MAGEQLGRATDRVLVRVEMRKTLIGVEEQYTKFVRMSVAEAIRKGVQTFEELLLSLPSIYPTDVLAAVDRLPRSPGVGTEVLARIRVDARIPRRRRPPSGNLLPLPHPLDFEWRFSDQTCREMLTAAADMTCKGETILLYGTPGLAYAAMSLPLRSRRVLFAGADTAVTRRLLELNQAAGKPISIVDLNWAANGCASAVLVDPPWYPDFLRPMLQNAAQACRLDGVVLASLPPLGIRPGVENERAVLAEFLDDQGLNRESLQELAISYETPFFESNALKAAGVFAPSVWRQGDLAVYRRRREPVGDSASEPSEERWEEVEIDGMRVRIRPNSDVASATGDLQSLVGGDILPSVSRRDPRRAEANVWTSGNRIFYTGNPMVVLEAAYACRGGYTPTLWRDSVEEDCFEALIERLRKIAVVEGKERARSARTGTRQLGRAA